MDCYILPDRYWSQLGLSIMRHCEDKVGVSRAVLNVPVQCTRCCCHNCREAYRTDWASTCCSRQDRWCRKPSRLEEARCPLPFWIFNQRLSSGFGRSRVDNLCCSNLAASAVAEAVSMNKFWFGGCMQKSFIRRPKNPECTYHYGTLRNSNTII